MKVFLMRYLFVMNLLVTVYGQDTGTLSGVILDHKSKEPLIGANVIVEGTSLGASTDYEGKNQIENIYYANNFLIKWFYFSMLTTHLMYNI